ncbi:MAG: cytochrome c oxidase accessory protein CcoG [Saprospiraceae bacterium]
MKNSQVDEISYRDKISTVDQTGKRKWIYAMQPVGRLYIYRTILSYIFLAILVAIPFIRWRGQPFILFDLIHGKFILFGKLFLPQDFILFGLAMLSFLLFIIVFTLAYGRVFCGWVCPQTIFLEMVFRKIEYWLEGSAKHQMMVDSKAWDLNIIGRKIIKHLLFFIISFLISNLFLSYFIGVDALKKIITDPISEHLGELGAILLFSIVFYIVFAFVRELVCTVICPYGRLQSVLLDKNSIVVSYDYIRGEPRARESKNRGSAGDCIDCGLCVQVCPTGIDIRNGTQMECTNCTACIDACNLMMQKTGRPEDLILFASEQNIKEGIKPRFTYRMASYTVVLGILLALMSFLLIEKKSVEIIVLRVPGQVLQENKDGTVSNLYRIKLINTTSIPKAFELKLDTKYDSLAFAGKQVDTLQAGQSIEELFFIKRPQELITVRKEMVRLRVFEKQKEIYSVKIPFIGLQ